MMSTYNEFKRTTPFEIKAGEPTKLHVVFGSTGMVETSASETEGGKWVSAYHTVYIDEDGKAGENICSPHSGKKNTGKCKLPIGKYIVRSSYNEFKKQTPISNQVRPPSCMLSLAVLVWLRPLPQRQRVVNGFQHTIQSTWMRMVKQERISVRLTQVRKIQVNANYLSENIL